MMLGVMARMYQEGFFKFVDIPIVLQKQILMVQSFCRPQSFPSCCTFQVVDVPVVQVVLVTSLSLC